MILLEKLVAYKMTVPEAEEMLREHLDNSGLHLAIRRTVYSTYYIAHSDTQELDGAELDERFAEILGVKACENYTTDDEGWMLLVVTGNLHTGNCRAYAQD